MVEREPYSITEVRDFINRAAVIYVSIAIELDDGARGNVEENVMVRISKVRFRRALSEIVEKDDRILCHFEGDGLILWVSS